MLAANVGCMLAAQPTCRSVAAQSFSGMLAVLAAPNEKTLVFGEAPARGAEKKDQQNSQHSQHCPLPLRRSDFRVGSSSQH
jgi:hypothetical protein